MLLLQWAVHTRSSPEEDDLAYLNLRKGGNVRTQVQSITCSWPQPCRILGIHLVGFLPYISQSPMHSPSSSTSCVSQTPMHSSSSTSRIFYFSMHNLCHSATFQKKKCHSACKNKLGYFSPKNMHMQEEALTLSPRGKLGSWTLTKSSRPFYWCSYLITQNRDGSLDIKNPGFTLSTWKLKMLTLQWKSLQTSSCVLKCACVFIIAYALLYFAFWVAPRSQTVKPMSGLITWSC